MSDPHVIEFARCKVEIWPEQQHLRTVFNTGACVPASPQTDAAYVAKAAAWGYASPWAMCVAHELGHTFVAQRLGLDYSPALFATAHNISRPEGFHEREEALVIAFQRATLGRPWPVWMTFPLRQVLQGGVAQFRDLVGGISE